MRINVVLAVLALGSLWFAPIASAAEPTLPWAFNGDRADGYSVDLVSVDPAPGTPLKSGAIVEFKITVSYSMTIAPHGRIIVVAQDEKDRPAMPGTLSAVRIG